MKKISFLLFILSFTFSNISNSQTTVGLLQHSIGSVDNGAILFAPIANKSTFLIDKCGKLIHTWLSNYMPAYSAYLLPDGSLLRTGDDPEFVPRGGIIEKIDWDGNVIWSYKISSDTVYQHHDIKALPNGNILVIVHEDKNQAEAISMGRNPSLITNQKLSSEKIVEIKPIGTDSAIVVWEWRVWDHLVQDFDNTKPNYGIISEHPELLNINFINGQVRPDWLHCNSVDYHENYDQIMISFRNIDEIWIIDHSTTTAEAATHTGGNSGKGGDILYRWGNSPSYGRGNEQNHTFFAQHDARWLKKENNYNGKIMVFNNGTNRPSGNFSSIDIITPIVDSQGNYQSSSTPFLPTNSEWQYTDSNPSNFYSATMSGAQLLSNGNILICDANKGEFFEIDSTKNIVWKYQSPISPSGPVAQGSSITNISDIFKCNFYPFTYSGFNNHDLISGQPIELNPNAYDCVLDTVNTEISTNNFIHDSFVVYPNPVKNEINLIIQNPNKSIFVVKIFNMFGQKLVEQKNYSEHFMMNISMLPNGVYYILIDFDNKTMVQKIIKN